MSLRDAKTTLTGVGKTIVGNAPGPKQLAQGFTETVGPVLPIWIVIIVLCLFGEPFCYWLTH